MLPIVLIVAPTIILLLLGTIARPGGEVCTNIFAWERRERRQDFANMLDAAGVLWAIASGFIACVYWYISNGRNNSHQ